MVRSRTARSKSGGSGFLGCCARPGSGLPIQANAAANKPAVARRAKLMTTNLLQTAFSSRTLRTTHSCKKDSRIAAAGIFPGDSVLPTGISNGRETRLSGRGLGNLQIAPLASPVGSQHRQVDLGPGGP